VRLLIVTLLFLMCTPLHADERPTLTVYTYSSFTADWGPGPAIKQGFEAECDCRLEYVATDDGVALLSRVRLEGKRSRADVVLGLDTNLMAEARATGLFASHGATPASLSLPGGWSDPVFLPYDYGYFAFVYDRTALTAPPDSLRALVEGPSDEKILIQDPRTSTPGLGLLLWIRKVYGDDAGMIWEKLAPRILTVSKGWSEAYGLFLKGEAPLVLSYTTSPAYHLIAEGEGKYAAAAFDEGHYLQVEVAAKLASSPNPELADRFLSFMLSQGFQKHIPTGNWMYPVVGLESGLPGGFETLVSPAIALTFTPEEVARNRKEWVQEWLNALSR
jgi:thiamine transport system substrate-binding protein